jgi:hypothetical protein
MVDVPWLSVEIIFGHLQVLKGADGHVGVFAPEKPTL